jgi:hypothetical protein
MVAVSAFSGLLRSPWARAAAMADDGFHWSGAPAASKSSNLVSPDFERLARRPWPTVSLASPGTSLFRSASAPSYPLVGREASAVGSREPAQKFRGTHIDDTDGFQRRFLRLTNETARTPPRSTTHRQNFFSAVSRRCWYRGSGWMVISIHFPPPLMIDRRSAGHLRPTCSVAAVPHAFGGALLRDRPAQHELGLEHRAPGVNQAVQRCRHPFVEGCRTYRYMSLIARPYSVPARG